MNSLTHLDPKHSFITRRMGALVHRRLFNRRTLWIWPLLAIPVLSALGYFVFTAVEKSIRDNAAAELTAIRDSDIEAIRIWMSFQEATAKAAARDRRTSELAEQLIQLAAAAEPIEPRGVVSTAAETSREHWVAAPQQYQLAVELAPELKSYGYQDYFLLDPRFRVISASCPELLGLSFPLKDPLYLEKLAAGKSFVTRPTPSFLPLADIDGQKRLGVPTMFAIAPLTNTDGKQFGMLALRIRPDTDFTRILSVGQFGQTGQTYAFDRDGRLLSRTRFDDELKQLGLIVDNDHSTAILALDLRDPQVDLSAGQHPPIDRDRMPLTTMATDAIAGHSGVNVDGYRNYLGVPTIGAWRWLPEYGFGVATEVEASEAYRAANIIRAAHWGMFSLMCGLSITIFGFTLIMARLERQVSEASIAMKQVGQYHLGDKLGQGGMGVVYRGQHALLQRPTAIKLLDPAKTSEESISRFEREVRLTSLLNHPNTITVYDFGRSDEGVFFYAMELLNGMDLEELVMRYGPQPPARVVHLLRQVCGSLAEAHDAGLIHRDIKPGNIMLTQRGGINDFIKVLDFGLVKAIRQEKSATLTTANALTGTPHYMSPEAIERADAVDARSDLYAVGAVGYFLLTGVPVFDGASAMEIFMAHLQKTPVRPSDRVNHAVPYLLEELLLKCLAKQPNDRPQSARELSEQLNQLELETQWRDSDSAAWWAKFGHRVEQTTIGVPISSQPELVQTHVICR